MEYEYIVDSLQLDDRRVIRPEAINSTHERTDSTEDPHNLPPTNFQVPTLNELNQRDTIGKQMMTMIKSNFSKIALIGDKNNRINQITKKLYQNANENQAPMKQLLKSTHYLDKLSHSMLYLT